MWRVKNEQELREEYKNDLVAKNSYKLWIERVVAKLSNKEVDDAMVSKIMNSASSVHVYLKGGVVVDYSTNPTILHIDRRDIIEDPDIEF